MDWLEKEYETLNFSDKRLSDRALLIQRAFMKSPSASIPSSFQSWNETKAAYRFFQNELVTPKKIIKPHRLATLKRIQEHPQVLLIQDTTSLNYSGQLSRDDIGPLQQDNVRGLYLHPTLAVTPDRVCLGVIDYEQWSREPLGSRTKIERRKIRESAPINQKESYRWVRGIKKANKLAHYYPETQFIYVADREGDIYDVYAESCSFSKSSRSDWVIRATFDRNILGADHKRQKNRMKAETQESGYIGEISFEVQSTNKRSKRLVTQSIYTKRVTLNPPRDKEKLISHSPQVQVIMAIEKEPPSGEEALEWTLLTSVEVNRLEKASEVLNWYLCRWQIEVYFKILKSGCNIEKLQLHEKPQFDNCLAMYLITAWRILYLTMLGRESPSVSAECFFTPSEWKTAYILLHKKVPPKKKIPDLGSMIKWVAQLGGFLARKSDGDPGITVIWRGISKLQDAIMTREALQAAYDDTYG
jgi:hypothetical protein